MSTVMKIVPKANPLSAMKLERGNVKDVTTWIRENGGRVLRAGSTYVKFDGTDGPDTATLTDLIVMVEDDSSYPPVFFRLPLDSFVENWEEKKTSRTRVKR